MMTALLPANFHFLRAEWLLALLPAALIVAFALRRGATAGAEAWARFVDPHLLRHLAQHGTTSTQSRALATALGVALVAAIIGLAGPTWRQIPTPTYDSGAPTVIALSLAQSMNTTDITPSRLTRAVHKLRDILARSKGDDVGLVIYSDTAFTAAPLTNDASVIKAMLPELSANLMPVLGNRPDLAIAQSRQLLTEAGAPEGRIVLLADNAGAAPAKTRAAARAAAKAGYRVEVVGIGTPQGGTLQTASGEAITDQNGKEITAAFNPGALSAVANAGNGHFATITAGDGDLNQLLPPAKTALHPAGRKQDINADRWQDVGYFLLILPVLLAPLAFRRGLLFTLALVALGFGLPAHRATAGAWQDLWQTPDQQGQKAFNAGAYDKAVKAFETPGWRGSAAYRKGDYAAAARDFSTTESPYNLGNALARQGKLKQALEAYDEALAKMPGDADATYNRALVKKLLEQQKKQKQQQKQSKGGQGKQDQKQTGQQSKQQQTGKGNQPAKNNQVGDQSKTAKQGQPKPHTQTQADTQAQKGGAEPNQEPKNRASQGQKAPSDAAQQPGDMQTPHKPQQQTQTQAQAQKQPEKSALSGLLDRVLSGNGAPSKVEPQAKANSPANSKLDQNTKQQLRRVPDDPSGLLRARIRQYYAQRRAAGGNQGVKQ